METKLIIEEVFETDDEDKRKKHFEEILIDIIKKIELSNTSQF